MRCTCRLRITELELRHLTASGSSSRCSRPNCVAWEWGFPSAIQSLRGMTAGFGFRPLREAAPYFSLYSRRMVRRAFFQWAAIRPCAHETVDASGHLGTTHRLGFVAQFLGAQDQMPGRAHHLLEIITTTAVDCGINVVSIKLEPYWRRIGQPGLRELDQQYLVLAGACE